ncbi:hypothetical protein LOAG_01438 [Loa loa]|nr:hypothetical protein LOAG_01438 [Loa loa]EFO27040.1 hypothetical protein LOAG_01438 [Loa loa]
MANMIGSEVLLNCTITIGNEANSASGEVEWWRDGQPIDFKNTKKYISKVKRDSRTIVHTLRILRASSEDDGSYSCKTGDEPESTHMLHVNTNLALYNGSRRIQRISWPLLILLFLLVSSHLDFPNVSTTQLFKL